MRGSGSRTCSVARRRNERNGRTSRLGRLGGMGHGIASSELSRRILVGPTIGWLVREQFLGGLFLRLLHYRLFKMMAISSACKLQTAPCTSSTSIERSPVLNFLASMRSRTYEETARRVPARRKSSPPATVSSRDCSRVTFRRESVRESLSRQSAEFPWHTKENAQRQHASGRVLHDHHVGRIGRRWRRSRDGACRRKTSGTAKHP